MSKISSYVVVIYVGISISSSFI